VLPASSSSASGSCHSLRGPERMLQNGARPGDAYIGVDGMYVRVVSFGTTGDYELTRHERSIFCFRRRQPGFNAAALMSGRRLLTAGSSGPVRFQLKERVPIRSTVRRDWQDIPMLTAPPIRWKDAPAFERRTSETSQTHAWSRYGPGTWRPSSFANRDGSRPGQSISMSLRGGRSKRCCFSGPGLGRERPRRWHSISPDAESG